jgi:REP element-mobilizing transposase RayT
MATHNREDLFKDLFSGRIVVAELQRLDREGVAISHAWVIMPDHVHWLLGLTGKQDLPQVAMLLKGRSARKINQGS